MLELFNFYEEAIRFYAPEASWCINNNSLDDIEWRSPDIEQPSNEDVEAKAQELYDAYVESYVEQEPSETPPTV